MEILLVLGVLVVGVAIFAVGVYNSLIVLKNKVDEGWADIDTQLKRRWDLIPNMVETVKGYAKHEDKVFIQVTEARTAAMAAKTPDAHGKAENMLTSTLKSLFAVAENYPELKANQNFMDLQATLKEIEEHIQMSRRYYNGTVRDFNTKLQVFPNNIVAGILGFKDREFFEIGDDEKQNVKVSFKDEEKPAAPAAAPAAPEPKAEELKAEEPKVEEPPAEEPPKEEEPKVEEPPAEEPPKEEEPKAEEPPAEEKPE
ncbi:LemA family protein [Patescibacteria group bacterium]